MFKRFRPAFQFIVLLALGCMGQLVPCSAYAQAAAWNAAARAYDRKAYDSALSAYLELESKGYTAAGLYYNIGNCYYRLGETGPAVYYYRKALLREPSDKKAAVNLALAEQRIRQPLNTVQPVFFIQWWKGLTTGVSPVIWGWFLFILWIGLLLLLYLKTGRSSRLPYLNRWLAFDLLLFLAAGTLFYYSYQSRYRSPLAVVMTDAPLAASPGQEVPVSGVVPEGTTVAIKSAGNGLYELRLPNGGSGWVDAGAVRKLNEP